jgi:hypothetical protein
MSSTGTSTGHPEHRQAQIIALRARPSAIRRRDCQISKAAVREIHGAVWSSREPKAQRVAHNAGYVGQFGTRETVSQRARAERYPQTSMRYLESSSGEFKASTDGACHPSIAATSLGVAGQMEGHANAFSKQTNCFFSPSARGTESFLDRRKPPRKCRLKECSPGETSYALICLGKTSSSRRERR